MKKIIVLAADENFMPLLTGLLDSLHQWQVPLSDAIGLLDLGLSDASLNCVAPKVDHIIQPGWDLYVREDIKADKPYVRANTARPFLPRYFPGYDLYLWMDADTWVQDRFAIDWLFQAASQGSMAIVPEIHAAYNLHIGVNQWRIERLKHFYEVNAAFLLLDNHYYNSGVFALHKDAIHWEKWAASFEAGLRKDTDSTSDQTALNYAIWSHRLPVHPLPAICNWCCHLGYPFVDGHQRVFREPFLPRSKIGILHLTDDTKDTQVRVSLNGKSIETGLRYRDLEKLNNIG